jgi:hypothetical protein
MPPSPSKWKLHLQILGVLAAIVALLVTALLGGSKGSKLDGLGEALAAIGLVMGFILHSLLSTVVVSFGERDRVAGAHVATAAALAATLIFQCR